MKTQIQNQIMSVRNNIDLFIRFKYNHFMKIIKYLMVIVAIFCLPLMCSSDEIQDKDSGPIPVFWLFGWIDAKTNNEIAEYEYYTNKPLKWYKKFDDNISEIAEYEYYTNKPLKWYSF